MSYVIADEPSPSEQFKQLTFSPSAPLLAMMMAGAWLAWPWFILNSFALGSPTRRREIQLVALGSVGSFVFALLTFWLVEVGVIESVVALQLAVLGITGWKLGLAYYVSTIQERTFSVYQYYGGFVQRPWPVLVLGVQLRWLVLGLSEDPIWRIIVSGLL